jgi:ribosomal protein L19
VKAGDSVSVHVKIKEGDRERIQEFKELSSACAKAAMINPSPFAA